VLPIKRPGDTAAPPAPAMPIDLDIIVNAAPTALFVRGHGLDAVLGGKLHAGGTSIAPAVTGGFKMQHGTFSLAGTTLNFVRGIVSFNGASASGKIDPSLDFEADNNSAGMIAKLLVGGYASAPKISLASDPPMPQDEILAHLLFGVSTQQLGPVQIATIAEALASISGIGGGGPGLLDRIRSGLGLDRLSVGSGSGNSISNSIPNLNQKQTGSTSTVNTSVEAGRYIANGVYVGAKQDTTGTGTQAEVQVDLTKRLKLETDMGTGPGGNNIGLSYQFQY
jgi:translocation and assembly module TamB